MPYTWNSHNTVNQLYSNKNLRKKKKDNHQRIAVVKSLSCVRLLMTPQTVSTPGSSVLHYLPEFAHIYVQWVGNAIHLILCHSLLLQQTIRNKGGKKVTLSIKADKTLSQTTTTWDRNSLKSHKHQKTSFLTLNFNKCSLPTHHHCQLFIRRFIWGLPWWSSGGGSIPGPRRSHR